MGRPKEGWKLRQRGDRPFEVRFTFQGQQYNIALGTHDRGEAEEKAERVYAATVTGAAPPRVQREKLDESKPFIEAGGEWLASAEGRLRAKTSEVYEVYLVRLSRAFPTLASCTPAEMAHYVSARLATVQARSVRKELSVLRSVLRYAHGQKWLRTLPTVPSLDAGERGTRFAQRRRSAADAISPDQIDRLIEALPEWSSSKRVPPFPIRARFILGYELGMRPELLNVLSVPRHWAPGRSTIWIPDENDKTNDGRTLPLTPRAQGALEAVAPASGLIFGDHDYRARLLAAALQVMPEAQARRFCGQHMRSAGLTHLAELGNLVGVQFIAGHRQISTTSRYVKASERAAAEVILLSARRRGQ